MTYPSPLPPPMAVDAHHLHLLSPQLLMDRELVAKLMEAHQAGLLMHIPSAGVIGKKRPREPLYFLGEEISSEFQQQMFDHDLLLINHTQQITAELTEQRRRFSRLILAAMDEEVRKQLREKDDEIETVKKLNWALEERVRSLCVENQIWRELAQTNEATVNLLRADLEQLVLAAQICVKEGDEERDIEPADDAESCCCGDNGGLDKIAMEVSMALRNCRSCGGSEATVLLLPCRHLCLCAFCSPTINFCPVCSCATSGSVNVNLS